ncbi:MAG: sigma-70 family RNA polymerase sigma factor [Myxococcota bacterium]
MSESRGLWTARVPGVWLPAIMPARSGRAMRWARGSAVISNRSSTAKTPAEESPEVQAWIKEACGGDDTAWGRVVRHYEADVARLCRRLLGSREEAEDVAQESFLRAQGALASYDVSRPFRRWLLSIAAHRAIDALRRRRREARLFEREALDPETIESATRSPLQYGIDADTRAQLLEAIAAQPDHYRSALVLRYYADLDYAAIAEVLSVSTNQVATLLHRGRARLRDALVRAR